MKPGKWGRYAWRHPFWITHEEKRENEKWIAEKQRIRNRRGSGSVPAHIKERDT